MTQKALSFAFLIGPGVLTRQALTLAASIRAFAGAFSAAPLYGLLEENAVIEESTGSKPFSELDVQIVRYSLPSGMKRFPFAHKVAAAAVAEDVVRKQDAILVWMDAHSLVLRSPEVLLLEPPLRFGCRPVDHLLIGSRYEEPVDPFWELVYDICQVAQQRLFSMQTCVDQVDIRPYINAGLLVVEPNVGVLKQWLEVFRASAHDPRANAFYDQDERYQIFMHQAILSGVLLRTVDERQIKIFPEEVNVPLHLFEEMPAGLKSSVLSQLVTCRYDVDVEQPGWLDRLTIPADIKSWLRGQWTEQTAQDSQA